MSPLWPDFVDTLVNQAMNRHDQGVTNARVSPQKADATRFQCCFCGDSIASDAITLNILLGEGGTQQIFCHLDCLQRVLHSSVPLAIWRGQGE
jgi:hypothetical protein